MIIGLTGAAGTQMPFRPIVRLAAGTILTRMHDICGASFFRGFDDMSVGVRVMRLENAAFGAFECRAKPGRVGHRKGDRVITIDVDYDELSMVGDRVRAARDDLGAVPVARDYLITFADRFDLAVQALIRWCDRKSMWGNRDRFVDAWDATVAALRNGEIERPHEFTIDTHNRDALDAAWVLLTRTSLDEERYEAIAEAYMLLRDAGWEDAEYEANPAAPATSRGQPARLANFSANLASAPPPGPEFCYALA